MMNFDDARLSSAVSSRVASQHVSVVLVKLEDSTARRHLQTLDAGHTCRHEGRALEGSSAKRVLAVELRATRQRC